MEIDKILDAGSGILEDVVTAVEQNEYTDLGARIQSRVREAKVTQPASGTDDTVYSGVVEPTNKKDGIYRTNYAENAGGSGKAGQADSSQSGSNNAHPGQTDYHSGAYSGSAYRRYSSDRRNGSVEPNSSSRARAQGTYQGNQNRAGYQRVYGSGNASAASQNRGQTPGSSHANSNAGSNAKGAYGKYDYRNPERMNNLRGGAAKSEALTPFNSKNVSTNTGVVPMVFGSMGMAVGGIGTAVYGITGVLAALTGGVAAVGAGILMPLLSCLGITGASGLLFSNGKQKKDVVEDYYQYGKYIGNAEFFKIDELAARLGIQENKLKKNLRKMMRQGLLPQARLDEEQDMMLLTDKAYDQYRQAADSYKKRREEEEKREQYFTSQDTDGVVRELLAEGNEYLKKVRHYNDLIPDTQEMSNKLYRLENIMYRIFEQVKNKPEMAQNLRRFMEYYLPTTEKLLSAYIEVDKQPQVGGNITGMKEEIDTAMDTINDAFEKLLDSLFEDLAWDISSDISVMKTMLEQDGLTTK